MRSSYRVSSIVNQPLLTMNSFRELMVWKKAIQLATVVYQATKYFPKEERYGLVSQLQRCVVSIGSNIAEGAGRGSEKEFSHFLAVATGSCYELETQLVISRNLGYLKSKDCDKLMDSVVEIQKMVYSLRKSLAE